MAAERRVVCSKHIVPAKSETERGRKIIVSAPQLPHPAERYRSSAFVSDDSRAINHLAPCIASQEGRFQNEADYDAALARITKLMDDLSGSDGQISDDNHPSRIELDRLVVRIEAYERERHPVEPLGQVVAVKP